MGLVASNQTVTNAAKDKKLKDPKVLAAIRDLTEYQAMVKSLNSTIPSGWKSSGEGEGGRGKERGRGEEGGDGGGKSEGNKKESRRSDDRGSGRREEEPDVERSRRGGEKRRKEERTPHCRRLNPLHV